VPAAHGRIQTSSNGTAFAKCREIPYIFFSLCAEGSDEDITRAKRFTAMTRRLTATVAVIAAVLGVTWRLTMPIATADSVVLDRDLVRSGCTSEGFCEKPIVLQFTSTTPNVAGTVTNIVGNKVGCPQIAVSAIFDGAGDTYFFPVMNGRPISLNPGSHSVALDGVCQSDHPSSFDHWGAHIQLTETGTPAPAGGQGPAAPPTNAVTLTFQKAGFEINAIIVNNSTLAGQCQYDAVNTNGIIPERIDNFPIGPKATVTRTYPAPPPLAQFHATVTCTGDFNGTTDEFGNTSADVTG
jgi:hypothetical protein